MASVRILIAMRVGVVYNATSGYGRGKRCARVVEEGLASAGHEVVAAAVNGAGGGEHGVEGCGALVLIGGDGTVHHALGEAMRLGIPIYQFATGTENLFARDWGMKPSVSLLARALDRQTVVEADVGVCNGTPFCLMCSMGIDAAVIHLRAAKLGAGGAPGHRGYVIPVLEQLGNPAIARVRVLVDGRELVEGRRGICIVANSRQYALRLDLAGAADPTDGLLDVVFLPCESAAGAARWGIAAGLGVHGRDPACAQARATRVEVESLDGPAACQIDGEPFGTWRGTGNHDGCGRMGASRAEPTAEREVSRLVVTLRPRALRVLDARNIEENSR